MGVLSNNIIILNKIYNIIGIQNLVNNSLFYFVIYRNNIFICIRIMNTDITFIFFTVNI